jgi:hypothetical protein
MRLHAAIKRLSVGVVAVAMACSLLMAPMANPADAGTCTTPHCGGVVINNSRTSIGVANCWDTTFGGFDYGDQLECMWNGWNPYAYNAGIRLGPYGDSSDAYHYYYYYYDVDGFRVFRGCRVWGEWSGGRTFSFNREAYSTSLWVRITGRTWAYIYGYEC